MLEDRDERKSQLSKCFGEKNNFNRPVTCLFFYISVFSVLRLKVPILNFAVNGIRNVDIGIESKATT